MSVPQFGGWDQKTDYSMVFSRARANKKQHKAGMRPSSLGNVEELMAYQQCQNDAPTMVNDPCCISFAFTMLSEIYSS
ncbi:hypothetical protein BHE74_00045721 [Ensete ventricosum]|nr:hypothetical protein GW17_00017588 [Ensete ventricosum]RWW48221.1 hypothetical protein BHE74_00045721 [Ensete ventricosum]